MAVPLRIPARFSDVFPYGACNRRGSTASAGCLRCSHPWADHRHGDGCRDDTGPGQTCGCTETAHDPASDAGTGAGTTAGPPPCTHTPKDHADRLRDALNRPADDSLTTDPKTDPADSDGPSEEGP